jgi:hypothetical protein
VWQIEVLPFSFRIPILLPDIDHRRKSSFSAIMHGVKKVASYCGQSVGCVRQSVQQKRLVEFVSHSVGFTKRKH